MDGVYFEVTNEAVVVHTRVFPGMEDVYKTEVVMPKEIFQECYEKWIILAGKDKK